MKAAIAKGCDILIYSYSMKYSISQRLWALKLQLKGCLVSEDQLESGHQRAMNMYSPSVKWSQEKTLHSVAGRTKYARR